jgi:hypothetical protein
MPIIRGNCTNFLPHPVKRVLSGAPDIFARSSDLIGATSLDNMVIDHGRPGPVRSIQKRLDVLQQKIKMYRVRRRQNEIEMLVEAERLVVLGVNRECPQSPPPVVSEAMHPSIGRDRRHDLANRG